MATSTVVTTIDALLPGVAVGDRFTIDAGSRVGRMRLRGDATIDRREPELASIAIACRVLGVRSHGRMEIALTDHGTISVDVQGLPIIALHVEGRPETIEDDLLELDIEPGDRLRVTTGEDLVEIVATGLRLGEICLRLVRVPG